MNVTLFVSVNGIKLKILRRDHPGLSPWALNGMTKVSLEETPRGETHGGEEVELEGGGENGNYTATSPETSAATSCWEQTESILASSLQRKQGSADTSIPNLQPPEQREDKCLLFQATVFVVTVTGN